MAFTAGRSLAQDELTVPKEWVAHGCLVNWDAKSGQANKAYQLVFFATLEGCFQDGLTDADADQILKKASGKTYEHFIYNCPICMATARALEAYLARPYSGMKFGPHKLTFGNGLTPEMHGCLFSDDVKQRLGAIHDLEEAWVARRVTTLRLSPEELARTQENLKAARDEGISLMQNFAETGRLGELAPAYHAGDECALCNAAAGMKLKLADTPAK